MTGVTLITGDGNVKEKLGVGRHILRPRTATDTNKHIMKQKPPTISEQHQQQQQQRSNSVDHGSTTRNIDDIASTIFLTDSSTISLPIPNQNSYTPTGATKYKTMPSPTRSNTILPGANCLNEIFEEGTDVGSSDNSATTTPRPVARHTHYVSNRTQSQGSASSSSSSAAATTTSAQRRSKFHKTRTASCSSSDASDDDSENRKKRAHKIVDSTKPLQPQRRDSHDDSSDSQDPGNATSSSGSNTTATCSIQQSIVGPPHDETTKNGDSRQSGDTNSNGRQKSGQPMGFRRHRAGRRRAGETRLRESQSLNRITEVQESEMPLSSMVQTNGTSSTLSSSSSVAATTVTTMPATNKPKGFSARLFHGFRKNDTTAQCVVDSTTRVPLQNVNASNDEVEMVLGVELAKALKVTETKSSSATKKLKMLGRYFQVNCYSSFFIFFFYFVC